MSNTFTIHNTLNFSLGGSWSNVSGTLYTTPINLLTGGAYSISVFAGDTIKLNGVDHNVSDIPVGFTVLTANWSFTLIDGHGENHGGTGGVPTCIGSTSSDGSVSVPHGGAGNAILSKAYTNKTIAQLIADQLTVGFSLTPGTYIAEADFGDALGASFKISGTYVVITVTSVSPTAGTSIGGTSVTIIGSGFSNLSSPTVNFGGGIATSVVVANDTHITCITPAHIDGIVDVTVIDGVTGSSYVAPSAYKYFTPLVSSVFPPFGGVFGGESVDVFGKGFVDGAPIINVFFDTTPATNIDVLNDTTLTCFTPVHLGGLVAVSVNFNGNIIASQPAIFLYEQYWITLNLNTPITVGDKVKISSGTKKLDTIIQIIITGSNGEVITIDTDTGDVTLPDGSILSESYPIIIQNEDFLWFYLPWGFGTFAGTISISLVDDGTQFSGSILAGTLTLFYEDASGIYTLTDGQTDDILYFRDGYITDVEQLMLPDLSDEDIYEIDFFSLLTYPAKILSDTDREDSEQGDFNIISTLRIPVVTESVEIPSPFISTAFLP